MFETRFGRGPETHGNSPEILKESVQEGAKGREGILGVGPLEVRTVWLRRRVPYLRKGVERFALYDLKLRKFIKCFTLGKTLSCITGLMDQR